MAKYIGSIDQGTTSTRFILFNFTGEIVASHQMEHKQHYPKPGWVEHDPVEIWNRTCDVIEKTMQKTGASKGDIAAVGITNQRETTVVWNRKTGVPYGNAIVWQDTRTSQIVEKLAANGGTDRFRDKTGLPLATYFSATKMQWILENRRGVLEDAEKGEAVFGTIDTWIVWNLTGGTSGGALITDVTNASRTLLMNLETLSWDDELLKNFSVPAQMLAEIKPSVPEEPYGYTTVEGPFKEKIPVAGILGDQQAAIFGQACFNAGSSKNTYGTGCFMLMNTGEELVKSENGLITTVAFQIGKNRPIYALEGSIAIAGSLVQWIRDNLNLIHSSPEIETLAREVEDSGDVYFVPAFSGLFAPHWRPDARGVITGLTGYVTRAHIARAVLESTAFQTREIFDAMQEDSGIKIEFLKVDGGMVVNELLMQFQSDMLDIPVIRPEVIETTALGAAYAAGLSVGFWQSLDDLAAHWKEDKKWTSQMLETERKHRYHYWKKAVERSLNWVEK
jgi:glycerol kinase